jgi:hypothetical protein
MVTYRTLAELEDAQDRERRTAQRRIEAADQYLDLYRSRMFQVRETFYTLGAREGVADDPGFRQELQRVSDATDETVAYAGLRIGELEEEYSAMLREHDEQRDRFLAERNDTD